MGCAFLGGLFHDNGASQGEWEGNAVDLVLGAMQAFPDAAFIGINLCPYLIFTKINRFREKQIVNKKVV